MTTFALLHGAYCAPGHWDRLVGELEGRRHRALAVDLPASDPRAGPAEYRDAAVSALEGAGDDVVLVGHSMGGITLPLVASARPVRMMVFLCALVPEPGRSMDETFGADPSPPIAGLESRDDDKVSNPDGTTSWVPARAIPSYFHDLGDEEARRAAALLRPQAWRILQQPLPIAEWPAVPSHAIVARDDRALHPDWVARRMRERLGVEPAFLDGGHFPQLSHPGECAALLESYLPKRR